MISRALRPVSRAAGMPAAGFVRCVSNNDRKVERISNLHNSLSQHRSLAVLVRAVPLEGLVQSDVRASPSAGRGSVDRNVVSADYSAPAGGRGGNIAFGEE